MADWQAGDQAMCVSGPPWIGPGGFVAPGPQLWSVHVVDHVVPGIAPVPPFELFLAFRPWPGICYWHTHFRKMPPLPPDDDEEVVRALRGERIPVPALIDSGRAAR